MKINHHFSTQNLHASQYFMPFLKPFIQPIIQHPFVRPFINPILQNPFLRQLIQHPIFRPIINNPNPNPNPITTNTEDRPTQLIWDTTDPTQRPDDPHLPRTNKRSLNTQQAANQLNRINLKWQDRNRDGKTEIAYSFEPGGWDRGFNEYQKDQARRSIQSWSDVANLTFTENARQTEGRLTFGISSFVPTAVGGYPTPYGGKGGSTRYNPNLANREVMTHEIGHALGLSHPGDYNGHAGENQRGYAQDSTAHTVMSYFSDRSSGKNLGGSKPRGPMMDDISAVQKLYGANHQTRNTDTTYGFNSNSGRDYLSLNSAKEKAIFCVWDGGGNDTLDFSGYRANQTINLKAGSFSDVGGLKGNVSIAHGATLENAIGGSGKDVLIGNDANNRLTGGSGSDRLRGGAGADTFVYNSASDSTPGDPDKIMDFTSGVDKIDVSEAMKKAGTQALAFVKTFTGRPGDSVIGHDPATGESSLAIDLTGSGQADLLIKTHGQLNPQDIIGAQGCAPFKHQPGTPVWQPEPQRQPYDRRRQPNPQPRTRTPWQNGVPDNRRHRHPFEAPTYNPNQHHRFRPRRW